MKGIKDSVQVSTPNLHEHDFSHRINTSIDFYQFRPVFCEEMYPKDKFEVNISDYFRAAPMAGAAYGSCYKKYAAFFIPYRILWDKWNDYLTGGSSGKLTFQFPYTTLGDMYKLACDLCFLSDDETDVNIEHNYSCVYRNMLDYWSDLGVPVSFLFDISDVASFNQRINEFNWPMLKFYAARRVWYDWYRDQNLIGDDVEDTYCPKNITGRYQVEEAADLQTFSPYNILAPLPVPVEKDYFTTAMLEPQRGGAAFVPVSLPSVEVNPGFARPDINSYALGLTPDGNIFARSQSSQIPPVGTNNIIGMFDYNLVRVAKGVQKYLEKNGIAGGADLQQLLAHWGTAPNPAVFQRSTYIGSFQDWLNLEEVVSPSTLGTGQSEAGEVTTKLNMTGKGRFEYTANEHGFFMVVLIMRPENAYVGATRRSDRHGVLGNGRFDFFTSELEKTGFQPQYLWELSDSWVLEANENIDPESVRGYVPRYAECKSVFNRYTGQMAIPLNSNLRIVRDFGNDAQAPSLPINTQFTSVYGYPVSLQYDSWFKQTNPFFDHFDGWINFDFKCISERNEYAAPVIENAKGNDITLPYAGVRM